jgi:hypothetical protein
VKWKCDQKAQGVSKEIIDSLDLKAFKEMKLKEWESKHKFKDLLLQDIQIECARTAEISRRSKEIQLIAVNETRKSEDAVERKDIERISDNSEEDGGLDILPGKKDGSSSDTEMLLDKLEKYEKQSRKRKRSDQSKSPGDSGSQASSPRDVPLRFLMKPGQLNLYS